VQLIGWKDKDSRLLVDVEEIGLLDRLSRINEEANCVHNLYPDGDPTGSAGSVWEDLVASPVRASIQRELKLGGHPRQRGLLPIPVASLSLCLEVPFDYSTAYIYHPVISSGR
jgi:hypothetical protein